MINEIVSVIEQYIDMELLVIILIAFFSYITLHVIFKNTTMRKSVENLITAAVIVGIGLLGYAYLEVQEVTEKPTFSNNYIVGKVLIVGKSLDKINIRLMNTNMPKEDQKDIVVNVTSSTNYMVKEDNQVLKSIEIDDLKLGDIVTVYCKETNLKNGRDEITAKKIIKKVVED